MSRFDSDEKSVPASGSGAVRSPPGSPSRSLLSRLSYSTSPKTQAYPRHTYQFEGQSPSKGLVAVSTNMTAPPTSATIMTSPTPPAAPSANPNTHPFTHGLELVGENQPYFLGVKDVTLADKYIKDEGCHRLVAELKGRGSELSVVSLDLRGNDIRRYGAEAIGELVRENTTIESLNLEWNFLGDSGGSGIEALCDALKTNRTLTSLDLRNNRLNSECGVSIGRLLICNQTLQHLDLRWNNLSVNGGAAIADALVRNHYIKTIALSGNRIPSSTVRAIEEALAKNRQVGLQVGASVVKSDNEPSLRIIELEQQLHDVHRELTHSLQLNQRNELELQEENKRCDELTAEATGLREKLDSTKQQATKTQAALQLELDKARLHAEEVERLGDNNRIRLKQLELDHQKLQTEHRLVQEDRSQLLLSKESSIQTLNQQLERLHQDLSKANETIHQKERQALEDRQEAELKLAHQRRLSQNELDSHDSQALAREKKLMLEMEQLKDAHLEEIRNLQRQFSESSQSSSDNHKLVLSLREQLLAQALGSEEAFAKYESKRMKELQAENDHKMKEFEARFSQLQTTRDDLVQANQLLKHQVQEQQTQLVAERQQHFEALEKERTRMLDGTNQLNVSQQEVYNLRAKLLEMEHRVTILTSNLEACQTSLHESSQRHHEQMEQVYQKHQAEVQGQLRLLRKSEEERSRLVNKLNSIEAEQAVRRQNLATALSALKSSISVVDENVSTTIKTGTGSSSAGDSHHHHHSSHHPSSGGDRHHSSHHHHSSSRRPHSSSHHHHSHRDPEHRSHSGDHHRPRMSANASLDMSSREETSSTTPRALSPAGASSHSISYQQQQHLPSQHQQHHLSSHNSSARKISTPTGSSGSTQPRASTPTDTSSRAQRSIHSPSAATTTYSLQHSQSHPHHSSIGESVGSKRSQHPPMNPLPLATLHQHQPQSIPVTPVQIQQQHEPDESDPGSARDVDGSLSYGEDQPAHGLQQSEQTGGVEEEIEFDD